MSASEPVVGRGGSRRRVFRILSLGVRDQGTLKQVGLFVGGLVLLTIGSKWLVAGAITIATNLGVSELIIGLTIVALGTSLPEVVTSIVASIRGQRDIAVGNVVGSNLFNILCVLGPDERRLTRRCRRPSPSGRIRHSRDGRGRSDLLSRFSFRGA